VSLYIATATKNKQKNHHSEKKIPLDKPVESGLAHDEPGASGLFYQNPAIIFAGPTI
jgi:hypothetical protein